MGPSSITGIRGKGDSPTVTWWDATPMFEESVIRQSIAHVGLLVRDSDDYRAMTAAGVEFPRPPAVFDDGKVAVFLDLHGNQGDLTEAGTTP